jgi:hypothetical protein
MAEKEMKEKGTERERTEIEHVGYNIFSVPQSDFVGAETGSGMESVGYHIFSIPQSDVTETEPEKKWTGYNVFALPASEE